MKKRVKKPRARRERLAAAPGQPEDFSPCWTCPCSWCGYARRVASRRTS